MYVCVSQFQKELSEGQTKTKQRERESFTSGDSVMYWWFCVWSLQWQSLRCQWLTLALCCWLKDYKALPLACLGWMRVCVCVSAVVCLCVCVGVSVFAWVRVCVCRCVGACESERLCVCVRLLLLRVNLPCFSVPLSPTSTPPCVPPQPPLCLPHKVDSIADTVDDYSSIDPSS